MELVLEVFVTDHSPEHSQRVGAVRLHPMNALPDRGCRVPDLHGSGPYSFYEVDRS